MSLISYPLLTEDNAAEVGGLSGRPLFPYALNALKTLRPLLPPSVPIIGAGGIWDGADALAMCRAGASTVQVYTAFGYRGVGTPRLLKDEITGLLDPGASWEKQVGTDQAVHHMRWDESRIAHEGAELKAEVAELQNVMAQIRDKREVMKLAAEADEALTHLAAMNASTLSADGPGQPADAVHGLAHAAPEVVVETPTGVDLIEAAPAPSAPAAPVNVDGAAVVIAGDAPPPSAVVAEAKPVAAPPKEDKFSQQVHSGNRRLV